MKEEKDWRVRKRAYGSSLFRLGYSILKIFITTIHDSFHSPTVGTGLGKPPAAIQRCYCMKLFHSGGTTHQQEYILSNLKRGKKDIGI